MYLDCTFLCTCLCMYACNGSRNTQLADLGQLAFQSTSLNIFGVLATWYMPFSLPVLWAHLQNCPNLPKVDYYHGLVQALHIWPHQQFHLNGPNERRYGLILLGMWLSIPRYSCSPVCLPQGWCQFPHFLTYVFVPGDRGFFFPILFFDDLKFSVLIKCMLQRREQKKLLEL